MIAKGSFDSLVSADNRFVTVLCVALTNKGIFTIDEIVELWEKIPEYTGCGGCDKIDVNRNDV